MSSQVKWKSTVTEELGMEALEVKSMGEEQRKNVGSQGCAAKNKYVHYLLLLDVMDSHCSGACPASARQKALSGPLHHLYI